MKKFSELNPTVQKITELYSRIEEEGIPMMTVPVSWHKAIKEKNNNRTDHVSVITLSFLVSNNTKGTNLTYKDFYQKLSKIVGISEYRVKQAIKRLVKMQLLFVKTENKIKEIIPNIENIIKISDGDVSYV